MSWRFAHASSPPLAWRNILHGRKRRTRAGGSAVPRHDAVHGANIIRCDLVAQPTRAGRRMSTVTSSAVRCLHRRAVKYRSTYPTSTAIRAHRPQLVFPARFRMLNKAGSAQHAVRFACSRSSSAAFRLHRRAPEESTLSISAPSEPAAAPVPEELPQKSCGPDRRGTASF